MITSIVKNNRSVQCNVFKELEHDPAWLEVLQSWLFTRATINFYL